MPRPDLDQPPEVLKLVGSPRPEETDAHAYAVYIDLSRELTESEQNAAAALGVVAKSLAGWVHIGDDLKHVIVADTTIEKVGQHRDSLKEIVALIAADGEERRQQAIAARRAADECERVRQAERTRRREAGKEIHFG